MKSIKFKPAMAVYALFVTLMMTHPAAFAQLAQAKSNLCGIFESVANVLNAVSVVVVTIGIIFAGYQIAFAHKRFSDVAPVLIGALMIGAASQIATMLLPNGGCSTSSGTDAAASALQFIQMFA